MIRRCNACRRNIIDIDYKDPDLHRYLTSWGRIKGRRETRFCSRHQRSLAKAIKRARYLALLSYVGR